MKRIEDYVISIPDFPEPGIIFRDITGILRDADGLKLSIDKIQEMLEGVEFDAVLGLESRGFIFGMPIAYNLHKAFIPVSCQERLFLQSTILNTAQRRLRFIRKIFVQA